MNLQALGFRVVGPFLRARASWVFPGYQELCYKNRKRQIRGDDDDDATCTTAIMVTLNEVANDCVSAFEF